MPGPMLLSMLKRIYAREQEGAFKSFEEFQGRLRFLADRLFEGQPQNCNINREFYFILLVIQLDQKGVPFEIFAKGLEGFPHLGRKTTMSVSETLTL